MSINGIPSVVISGILAMNLTLVIPADHTTDEMKTGASWESRMAWSRAAATPGAHDYIHPAIVEKNLAGPVRWQRNIIGSAWQGVCLMPDILVIVPCGKSKIWDKQSDRGPTAARGAYTGTPFKLNCRYAECFGDAWVVLSAKYGLIKPEFEISGPYEVAFTKPRTCPIATESLQQQVEDLGLNR